MTDNLWKISFYIVSDKFDDEEIIKEALKLMNEDDFDITDNYFTVDYKGRHLKV